MSVGMLEIKDSIDDQDETFLETALKQYAELHSCPPYKETPLSIIKRDSNGHLVAGLTAQTVWNWLYIDMLWVDEALRGQGIGSVLVAAAEKEALARGCHSAYLWTQSYEGPDFYPKLGYEKFVVNQDFPVGFQRIGFMKRLAT
ncbi:MAG: GNAT family N-acetyltransferase [Bdellovibrionales bacterium]